MSCAASPTMYSRSPGSSERRCASDAMSDSRPLETTWNGIVRLSSAMRESSVRMRVEAMALVVMDGRMRASLALVVAHRSRFHGSDGARRAALLEHLVRELRHHRLRPQLLHVDALDGEEER